MSSIVTVDLAKNPEIAALLAEMEPGAKVYGCFTLKSRDEQTAQLRIEEMTDNKDDLPDKKSDSEDDDDADDDGDDESEQAREDETERAAEKPGKTLAAKLTSAANSGY